MQLKDILQEPLSKEEFYIKVKNRYREIEKRRGITTQEKGESIKKLFPEIEQYCLHLAQYGLEGKVKLPGTGGVFAFAGNPPDWKTNIYQTNEYMWQLNRMDHWIELLEAYTLTNDRKYADKVVQELNDWIEKMPRPVLVKELDSAYKAFNSVNGWRSLECGIRLHKTWPRVIDHLMGTEILTPELLEKFAISVYEQAEVLAEICPMFFPKADHNHYVMENLGLLWAACYFPEFKNAEKWKEQAMQELERCMKVQMTDDGGHVEGCPMYHNGCVRWFTLGILIAKDVGLSFTQEYMRRLEKSLEYSIYSFRPTGTAVPWGDSKANHVALMGGFYGFLAFGRTDFIKILCDFTSREAVLKEIESHIWFLNDMQTFAQQFLAETNELAQCSMPLTSWQKQTKQVAMRTDWSKEALSLFFACYTPIHTGHTHMDPMGFDFTALGKPLLVDPGYYTYENNDERRTFKSCQYHNTLTINERDPFEYISSFKYGPQKEGEVLQVGEKRSYMFAVAKHLNYDPIIHKRLVAIVDRKMLIVIDHLAHIEPKDLVQIYYHINSTQVLIDETKNCIYTNDEDVNVVIYATKPLKGQLLKGQISESTDCARDSIRLRLEDQGGQTEESRAYATVIVPYIGKEEPCNVEHLKVLERDGQIICEFKMQEEYSVSWDIGKDVDIIAN